MLIRRLAAIIASATALSAAALVSAPVAHAATCIPIVSGDSGAGVCVSAIVYDPDPAADGVNGVCWRIDVYYEVGGPGRHVVHYWGPGAEEVGDFLNPNPRYVPCPYYTGPA